jgi:WD40 repeat protein
MSQGRPQAHEENSDHPFGVAIKQFLSQKRLSQAKLAQTTDLDPAIINKMIKGQRLEGSGGRYRVLTVIRGLHELGVLRYIEEANDLLGRIPTMGALDGRVKEELALLKLLETKEPEPATVVPYFLANPVSILETEPVTLAEIITEPAIEMQSDEGIANHTFEMPNVKRELAEPAFILEPAEAVSLPPLEIITPAETNVAIEPTNITAPLAPLTKPETKPLPFLTRFSWGALLLSLILLIGGGLFITFGRNQADVQASVRPTNADTQTTPLSIAVTNAGAIDLVSSLQPHTNRVNTVSFSPDGQLIASGSDDRTISISLMKNKERQFKLEAHSDGISSVAFSPDGKILASSSLDKNVILWDTFDGTIIRRLIDKNSGAIASLAFSPDGKTLVAASYDKTIYIWNVSDGRLIKKLEAHSGAVSCVVFSSNGKYLASGSFDYSVIIWDTENWTQLHRLEGHSGAISSLSFMPDTPNLASGSYDSTVQLWRVDNGTRIRIIEHPGSVSGVAFNPQGTILASVGGSTRNPTLWLRRVRDGATLLELKTEAVEAARGVTFSPGGEFIAIPFDDRTVKLWGVSRRYLNNDRYEIIR